MKRRFKKCWKKVQKVFVLKKLVGHMFNTVLVSRKNINFIQSISGKVIGDFNVLLG